MLTQTGGGVQGADEFDIEATPQRLPQKHVVAVRITSENASDGFKPTAGRVDEVRHADLLRPCKIRPGP